MINRKVVLPARREGHPKPSDFKVIDEPVPELQQGQVLLATEHLSVDAFIRTTLDGEPGLHSTTDLKLPVAA